MKSPVYKMDGTKSGDIELPEAVFGVKWNPTLVHQVVTSLQSNARMNVAHTKDRSEVSGGGKKPHRQKGTGRARHGSNRSPIWRGGGITFGPRAERNYEKKVNRKMRNRALFSVLSKKLADGEVLFVEGIAFDEPKTAEAKTMFEKLAGIKGFEALGYKKKNAALVALPERNEHAELSLRNFNNIAVEEVRNLNPIAALRYKYLVIAAPKSSLAALNERAGAAQSEEKAATSA